MENKWIKTTDALPKGCGEVLGEQYTNGRNDGIKEFAENAKKNHLAIFNTIYSHTHFCEMIDNLAKEMTESENGNV